MKYLITFFLFFTLINTHSQENKYLDLKKTISKEKIFLHINSSVFVTGESLLYKAYCNDLYNKPSRISKVIYIELVSREKKTILKQKLKLNNGKASGDLFLNNKLKTGIYKLVAYTQWMRNDLRNNIFEKDILVINPFQLNSKQISEEKSNNSKTTIAFDKINNNKKDIQSNLFIYTDKDKYKTRSEVILYLKTKNNNAFGKYSISVRRKDSIFSTLTINNKNIVYQKKDTLFLPDLRGELISGRIIDIKNNKPIKNCLLSLTIPDENFIFKLSSTNENGEFFFNINEVYHKEEGIISILNNDIDKDVKIIVNDNKSPDYSFLTFKKEKLIPNIRDYISERSIYNQIENSYFSLKKDSILKSNTFFPFYHSKTKEYFLDDYTRFNTVKETIVEIINEVYIKKKKNKISFHIRYNLDQIDLSTSSFKLPTLILIDGHPIKNHNDFYIFNPRKIKSILIVKDKYLFNKILYGGIISIETFKKDYYKRIKDQDTSKRIILQSYTNEKLYFSPNYKNQKLSRIPDYRYQLYWNPYVDISKLKTKLSFYTSDVTGEYEISIKGYTSEGAPVYLSKTFKVE